MIGVDCTQLVLFFPGTEKAKQSRRILDTQDFIPGSQGSHIHRVDPKLDGIGTFMKDDLAAERTV